MSGCAICVYDLYIEAKAAYSKALAASLTALEEQSVPKSLWPKEVLALSKQPGDPRQTPSASLEDDGPLDASIKAFMELEKRLKKSS
jgi:hypothetical protein